MISYLMQGLNHFEEKHQKIVVVNWVLGNRCNYKCSYCPQELHDSSEDDFYHPEYFPLIQKFSSEIISQIKMRDSEKEVCFLFSGGEITLYVKYFELLEYIKSLGGKVAIVSNGSRPIEFWKNNKNFLDHLALSFHPQYSQIDHFKEIINLLGNHLPIHVNIMMDPQRFDYCKKVAQELATCAHPFSISLQPLLRDLGSTLYDYTSEQLKVLKNYSSSFHENFSLPSKINKKQFSYRGDMMIENFNKENHGEKISAGELIARGKNKWTGMQCNAGLENIIIDLDGEVYRSWCFLQEDHPTKKEGHIGNILEPHFKLPNDSILCKKKYCHCTLDIMCTKKSL